MKLFFKAFFVLALTTAALVAQTVSISGTVKDSSGLAVPGAEVNVTQTDTGFTRTVQSANDGAYLLPSLPIGPYRLEVRKAGFAAYVQNGIVLQVDTNPAIEVGLKVGSVSEQVVVEAAAAMVETQSTGVGQVINQQQVVDLPLNGRQATDLIFLSGAATTGPNGQLQGIKNYPNETIIALAGPAVTGITYMLDGGTHNDPFNSLNLPLPFPDALQEFKVETSALPAQYGYHSAGAVNAVTKSGTNAYHGDAFEFVRNTYFNARDTFATTGDGLKRNQFGGTIGGPILKNKLFFFAGYQNTTVRSTPANNITYLPTPAMVAGDFTTYASPLCQAGRQITLKAPFVGNKIAPSLLNASAIKATTYFPLPDDLSCGKITYSSVSNSAEYFGVTKFDYRINDKHSVFGRYLGTHSIQPAAISGAGSVDPANAFKGHTTVDDFDQSAVFGDTYIFGSSTINSFHATLTRTAIAKNPSPSFTAANLGVNVTPLQPYAMYFTVSGAFSGGGLIHTGSYITTQQIADDFSLIRGTHQIGFGVNWIRPNQNAEYNTWIGGMFSFAATQTGLSLGDFMLGDVSSFTQNNVQSDTEHHKYVGLYVQDSWKIKPNLSLSYGLRWEPYMGPQMKYGYVSHFDQADFNAGVHSTVYPNAPAGTLFPGDAGFNTGDRPTNTKLNDFAPRFGAVWDPKGDGKMTVRASWGMFYDLPFTIQFYSYAAQPPWGGGITVPTPPGGFSNPWQGFPGGNPYPLNLSNKNFVFPTSGSYLTAPLNIHPSYVEAWNVTLQRQMGSNWLFSASYLASETVHMWSSVSQDPALYIPGNCVAGQYGLTAAGACSSTTNTAARRILTLVNPAQGAYYNSISQIDDGGTGSYNALLVSVNHRLSNHFSGLANYTWAHCIADPISQYVGGSYSIPSNRRFDRGNCPGGPDQRSNVNLSVVAESPRFSQRFVQMVAGNWKLSTILSLHSGAAFSAANGVDTSLTGSSVRPNQVLANPYCATKTLNCWLNPAAFAAPGTGTFGNVGVGTLVPPGYFNVNVALSRGFVIRERQKLEIRAEAFNIENRVNLGAPNATLSGATFGQITTDVQPRITQFAIKYTF